MRAFGAEVALAVAAPHADGRALAGGGVELRVLRLLLVGGNEPAGAVLVRAHDRVIALRGGILPDADVLHGVAHGVGHKPFVVVEHAQRVDVAPAGSSARACLTPSSPR